MCQAHMPKNRATIERLRRVLAPEYERNVKELLQGRYVWKKTHDTIEVISKIFGGVASVIAFASSSVRDTTLSHWLGFVAGCTGTLALVLMVFSTYSARTSRERTKELNTILKVVGVTPIPQLVSMTDVTDGQSNDIESPPSNTFDPGLLKEVRVSVDLPKSLPPPPLPSPARHRKSQKAVQETPPPEAADS